MAKLKDEEAKELWVSWTQDALGVYAATEDLEDGDGLIDDMVDVSTKYADAMLEEFEQRFCEGPQRKKAKKKSRKRPARDDADDDEEEEEVE